MNTKQPEIKAVILDLDQTLTTDEASWLQFTELLGADKVKHTEIFEKFKSGELSYPAAKTELISLWRDVNNLDRKSIEQIFAKVEFREGAAEAVAYLKTKYKLCIISGAIDVFVEVAAQKLGIEDKYSTTKFKFDSEDKLVDFDYKLSRGEDKLQFFEDFCRKHNIDPKECAAIGDGDSDMPIFSKVGLPILFLAAETTKEQKKKVKVHLEDWNEIQGLL